MKYRGLGEKGMSFDEAMELVKRHLADQDAYVMDILFDILMEEENDPVADGNPDTPIYNWS